MSNTLPVTVQGTALPPGVRWTPQQLADFIWAKARIVTSASYALFVAGSTEPSSNVGPWWKDNSTWYRWDDGVGGYVPQEIDSASLGYFIGEAEPDPSIYNFWIQTNAFGSPLALKIYYSGAWVDVYAATLANYLTSATAAATYAPLASPALTGNPTAPTQSANDNSTKIATTAYVDNAVGSIVITPFAAYPAQGSNNAAQSIPADGTETVIVMDVGTINPAPAPLNLGTYRYIAPAAGYYLVSFTTQFDNDTATASGVEIIVGVFKNGSATKVGDVDSTPSPNGSRWSPAGSGIVQLAANDYLDLRATITDGVGTGAVDLTTFQMSVTRLQAV